MTNNELILKEIDDLKAEIETLKDQLINPRMLETPQETPHDPADDLTIIPIFECC